MNDWLHTLYLGWLGATPCLAAFSFWWWKVTKGLDDCSSSVGLTSLAVLPGFLLWLEHCSRQLGAIVGRSRALQVYDYPTTLVTVLWAPALVLLFLAAAWLRRTRSSTALTNALQAAHFGWASSSTLVALYFASGI